MNAKRIIKLILALLLISAMLSGEGFIFGASWHQVIAGFKIILVLVGCGWLAIWLIKSEME